MSKMLALLLLGMMLSIGGCSWSIGGRREVVTSAPTQTLGQQLMDLQKAHEMGAIDDEDYQRVKRRLLANPEG